MIRAMIERVAGYPGLFLLCASSGIVLPVPEDVALLYTGSQIETGAMQWGPALCVAFLGVFVRDLFAYGIGRTFGNWLLARPAAVAFIGRKRLDKARALVEARGASAVLAGRFLIGLRAPVFFVAGAMGVPFRKFLLWNVLGLLVVVPGVVALGYVFGPPLAEGALFVVRHLRVAFAVAMLAGCAALVWWRIRAERRAAIELDDEIMLNADPSDPMPRR